MEAHGACVLHVDVPWASHGVFHLHPHGLALTPANACVSPADNTHVGVNLRVSGTVL